jgi:hypothetical protein
LEASGRLTLEVARAVAETGVDYLAVGALTHSAPVLDDRDGPAGPLIAPGRSSTGATNGGSGPVGRPGRTRRPGIAFPAVGRVYAARPSGAAADSGS